MDQEKKLQELKNRIDKLSLEKASLMDAMKKLQIVNKKLMYLEGAQATLLRRMVRH